MTALLSGRGVMLQGDYDRFSLSVSCQEGFTGGHMIYINHVESKVTLYVGDPLCSSYKPVPLDQVREYAEKLAEQERKTVPFADRKNHLFYAVTKITPPSTGTGVAMPGPTFNPEGTPVIGSFAYDSKPHALIRGSDGMHEPVTPGLKTRAIYAVGFLTTSDGRFKNEKAYLTEITHLGEAYYALAKDGTFTPATGAGTNATYNKALDDSIGVIGKLRK
jgi:hypothetical protein